MVPSALRERLGQGQVRVRNWHVLHAFVTGKIHIDELAVADRTLPIDSKVLERAEARADDEPGDEEPAPAEDDEDDERPRRKLTRQEQAERLRVQVDTVGQQGKPGERIQNVIAVAMLTEGGTRAR